MSNRARKTAGGSAALLNTLAKAAWVWLGFLACATSVAAKSGPTSIAYVEVNSDDLANVGRYTLADQSNAFDVAIIFAANINYDGAKAYLYCNDRVQATLDDAANQIRPLQAKGIKVAISILGNHQGAGVSNFKTPQDAEDFAMQITDLVHRYGLDGVDFDDEYAQYGRNGTPSPHAESVRWLVTALRRNLPDKIISFYDIGPASSSLSSSSPDIGAKLDYAWNAFYGTYRAPRIPGLTRQNLSPAAVDIQRTPQSAAADLASRTVSDGYGVFMTYNLPAGDRSAYISSFTQRLYGQPATYR